MVAHDILPQV